MISEPTFEAPAVELSEKGPWQQMANESTKAFATFSEFLELGPDASLQDVVAKTGKSLSAVRSLSSRFQWFARAAAWRQHFAAIKGHALQRATEKTVELWAMREQALRELEWENSQKLTMFCLQAINQHLTKPETEVAPYELRGLFALASKLGHQAISTQNHAGDVGLGPNSDFVLRQLNLEIAKACGDDPQAPLPPEQPATPPIA